MNTDEFLGPNSRLGMGSPGKIKSRKLKMSSWLLSTTNSN